VSDVAVGAGTSPWGTVQRIALLGGVALGGLALVARDTARRNAGLARRSLAEVIADNLVYLTRRGALSSLGRWVADFALRHHTTTYAMGGEGARGYLPCTPTTPQPPPPPSRSAVVLLVLLYKYQQTFRRWLRALLRDYDSSPQDALEAYPTADDPLSTALPTPSVGDSGGVLPAIAGDGDTAAGVGEGGDDVAAALVGGGGGEGTGALDGGSPAPADGERGGGGGGGGARMSPLPERGVHEGVGAEEEGGVEFGLSSPQGRTTASSGGEESGARRWSMGLPAGRRGRYSLPPPTARLGGRGSASAASRRREVDMFVRVMRHTMHGLEEGAVLSLYDKLDRLAVKPGDVVFKQGAPASDGMFMVLRGEVGLYAHVGHNVAGGPLMHHASQPKGWIAAALAASGGPVAPGLVGGKPHLPGDGKPINRLASLTTLLHGGGGSGGGGGEDDGVSRSASIETGGEPSAAAGGVDADTWRFLCAFRTSQTVGENALLACTALPEGSDADVASAGTLFVDATRPATCVAHTEAVLLRLDRNLFRWFVDSYPNAVVNFVLTTTSRQWRVALFTLVDFLHIRDAWLTSLEPPAHAPAFTLTDTDREAWRPVRGAAGIHAGSSAAAITSMRGGGAAAVVSMRPYTLGTVESAASVSHASDGSVHTLATDVDTATGGGVGAVGSAPSASVSRLALGLPTESPYVSASTAGSSGQEASPLPPYRDGAGAPAGDAPLRRFPPPVPITAAALRQACSAVLLKQPGESLYAEGSDADSLFVVLNGCGVCVNQDHPPVTGPLLYANATVDVDDGRVERVLGVTLEELKRAEAAAVCAALGPAAVSSGATTITRRLAPGCLAGAQSCFVGLPHRDTAIAVTVMEVAVFPKRLFSTLADSDAAAVTGARAATLVQISLAVSRSLVPLLRMFLSLGLQRLWLKSGETLFRSGDATSDGLYVVISGRLRTYFADRQAATRRTIAQRAGVAADGRLPSEFYAEPPPMPTLHPGAGDQVEVADKPTVSTATAPVAPEGAVPQAPSSHSPRGSSDADGTGSSDGGTSDEEGDGLAPLPMSGGSGGGVEAGRNRGGGGVVTGVPSSMLHGGRGSFVMGSPPIPYTARPGPPGLSARPLTDAAGGSAEGLHQRVAGSPTASSTGVLTSRGRDWPSFRMPRVSSVDRGISAEAGGGGGGGSGGGGGVGGLIGTGTMLGVVNDFGGATVAPTHYAAAAAARRKASAVATAAEGDGGRSPAAPSAADSGSPPPGGRSSGGGAGVPAGGSAPSDFRVDVGRGETVGELSVLIREKRRNVTAVCIRDCELVRMSQASYAVIAHRYPAVMTQFTRVLAHRYQEITKRLVSGATPSNVAMWTQPAAAAVQKAVPAQTTASLLREYGLSGAPGGPAGDLDPATALALNAIVAGASTAAIPVSPTAARFVTIAVVPAGGGSAPAPIADFAAHLVLALERLREGPVLHLTCAKLEQLVGAGTTAKLDQLSVRAKVAAWLSTQEEKHRFMVLEADAGSEEGDRDHARATGAAGGRHRGHLLGDLVGKLQGAGASLRTRVGTLGRNLDRSVQSGIGISPAALLQRALVAQAGSGGTPRSSTHGSRRAGGSSGRDTESMLLAALQGGSSRPSGAARSGSATPPQVSTAGTSAAPERTMDARTGVSRAGRTAVALGASVAVAPRSTPWTRMCVQQADLCLLVGLATASSELSPAEAECVFRAVPVSATAGARAPSTASTAPTPPARLSVPTSLTSAADLLGLRPPAPGSTPLARQSSTGGSDDTQSGDLTLTLPASRTFCTKELVLLHPDPSKRPRGTRNWLRIRRVTWHHHVRTLYDDDYDRIARHIAGKARALVLGGGGSRGLAHLGAFQELEERGIGVDMIGGTSQGAFMAACYAMTMDVKACVPLVRRLAETIGSSWGIITSLTLPLLSYFSGAHFNDALVDVFRDTQIEVSAVASKSARWLDHIHSTPTPLSVCRTCGSSTTACPRTSPTT